MKRTGNLPGLLALAAVLAVIGLAITVREVREFKQSEYAEFRTHSVQMAGVLARATGGWIVQGNLGAIQGTADMLLAGSGQYVVIEANNQLVLDSRIEDAVIREMHVPFDDIVGEDKIDSVFRANGLDVILPLISPRQPGIPIGSVRIGFSDREASSRVRDHRLLVFGIMSASWFAAVLLIVLLLRNFALHRRLISADGITEPEGIIRAGCLEIDTDSCTVRFGGTEIELTPKMFDLLAYLARNMGKTFSDAALLEALWADAPYAASNDVKQCIYMLRRRLRAAHPNPKQVIVNVKGFGYRLETPTETAMARD